MGTFLKTFLHRNCKENKSRSISLSWGLTILIIQTVKMKLQSRKKHVPRHNENKHDVRLYNVDAFDDKFPVNTGVYNRRSDWDQPCTTNLDYRRIHIQTQVQYSRQRDINQHDVMAIFMGHQFQKLSDEATLVAKTLDVCLCLRSYFRSLGSV